MNVHCVKVVKWKGEMFIEDGNELLNTTDILNLYGGHPSEIEKILEKYKDGEYIPKSIIFHRPQLFVEQDGQIISLQDIAISLSLSPNVVKERFRKGYRGKELFSRSLQKTHIRDQKISYLGVEKTLGEWAKHLDMPYRFLYERYKKGMRGESLLQPKRASNKPK